jgi:hypothetical protein
VTSARLTPADPAGRRDERDAEPRRGERSLANAVASCPADAAGVTLVTSDKSTYLVTSYTNCQGISQAVGAAPNMHGSLAAGLRDAVKRMATIDPGS